MQSSNANTSLYSLGSGSLLYAFAPAAIFLMPMLIGGYVDELGFSQQQASLLASIEAAGICVGSLLALFWVKTINWRTVSLVALVIMAISNLFSTIHHEFIGMLASRAAMSLAAGTLYAVSTATLAEQLKPERAFGIALGVQTIVVTILMAASVSLLANFGINGLFTVLAILSIVTCFSLVWIPSKSNKLVAVVEQATPPMIVPTSRVVAALIATGLYFTGAFGFWVCLERIAHVEGHSNAVIGTVLTSAVAIGILGSFVAAWMSDRYGRKKPIVISLLLSIVIVLLAIGSGNLLIFTASVIIFYCLWLFSCAYQTALIAKLDPLGRYTVLIPAAQGIGLVIGPMITFGVFNGDIYKYVSLVVALLFSVSLTLFFVALRSLRPLVSGNKPSAAQPAKVTP